MTKDKESVFINPKNGIRLFMGDFKDTPNFRTDFLSAVSVNIPPEDILGVNIHDECIFVYFTSISHVLLLLKEGLKFKGNHFEALYLFEVFTAYNVPLTVSNSEIANNLLSHGLIKEVKALPFCSSVPGFSHILSSERRIYVEIKPKETCSSLPEELNFTVNQVNCSIRILYHCIICVEDGHSTNKCEFKWSVGDQNVTCFDGSSPIYLPTDTFQCISENDSSVSQITSTNQVDVPNDTGFSSDHSMPRLNSPVGDDNPVENRKRPSLEVSSLCEDGNDSKQEKAKRKRSSSEKAGKSKRKKGGRPKSKLWQHFKPTTEYSGKKSTRILICIHCDKKILGYLHLLQHHSKKCIKFTAKVPS